MDDGHQCPGHLPGFGMLDDIAPIHDAAGALTHELSGAFENRQFIHPAAAARQYGPPARRLHQPMKFLRLIGWIALDEISTEFYGLAYQRGDTTRVARTLVVLALSGIERQRLDHQGHPVAGAFRLYRRNVGEALAVEFRLPRYMEQVDHHGSRIQSDRLLDRRGIQYAE